MSHTIRNERTKGWLDKLAKCKARTRKLIKEISKNEDFGWILTKIIFLQQKSKYKYIYLDVMFAFHNLT